MKGIAMSLFDWLKQVFGTSASPRPTYVAPPPPLTDEQGWHKALADFGYSYDLVPGEGAEHALKDEQELGRRQAFTPILIVPGPWNSEPVEADERTRRAREALAGGVSTTFAKDFLAERFAGNYEDVDDPEFVPVDFAALRPVAARPLHPGLSIL
jgi:hypothetical protein